MSSEGVLLEYQERLHEIQASLAAFQSRQFLTAAVFGAAVILFLALGFLTLSRRTIPIWYSPLSLPVALVSARNYGRLQASRLLLARLRDYYARGVARLQGDWAGRGQSGEEFWRDDHVYARDLNLFGTGSLFERLCIVRTQVGKGKLAAYLLDSRPSVEECLARQTAVRELRDHRGLRERIATLGMEFNQSSMETFSAWLNRDAICFAPWLRWLAMLLGLATPAASLLLVCGVVRWEGLASFAIPLLALQVAFGWVLRGRVLRVVEHCHLVSAEIGLVREGLELLARQEFESPKLRSLVQRVGAQQAGREIRRLELYLKILGERTKEWFYAPSLLLLAGSQCAMAIEEWRIRHNAALPAWLDAWAEFEALNAIACHAYENPGGAFPEIEQDRTVFEAEGLGHPLLPAEACVRNDVRLQSDGTRVLIVSGSNMSGKSTLLRSIGVAAVLAAAGAPVPARRLRLSLFSVCASLSIQDAIQEGKSKFMAELSRLRESIRLSAEQPPVLFLIDEILSGTNSRDRRIASEAVIRTLVASGAVGAISTHDLSLTGIAGLPDVGGENVHMGSRDVTDPLAFDYVLKPGVTTEANALAIARLAGVPV